MATSKSCFIELSSMISNTYANHPAKLIHEDRENKLTIDFIIIIIFEIKYLIKLIIEKTFYRVTSISYFIGLTKC